MRRVREFLRPADRSAPVPTDGRLTPSERRAFSRGYRAGVAFALSLLPAADADLTMFDLKGVRAELKDRS